MGYRAGYVAQDGADEALVPWSDLDALFIGGTNAWRDGTDCPHRLVEMARSRGKRTHWGRVNTEWGMDRAWKSGCDSADGTYLAYGPDVNLPKLLRWLDGVQGAWQGLLL